MRVLVVEDEPVVTDVLVDFLREHGDEPATAATAEAALQIIAREPPHLILLDVKLPGMSGLDFVRDRTVQASGIPIIVMSGLATETEARNALAAGAVDFLAKPISLDHLMDVLDAIAPLAPAVDRRPSARPDRRPARRVRVSLELQVMHGARVWHGRCVELSATGMKARMDASPAAGSTVRLTFALPDSPVPLDVLALVVRVDADGPAFRFRDLAAGAAARVERLVAGR